jgi:hypothetical protein
MMNKVNVSKEPGPVDGDRLSVQSEIRLLKIEACRGGGLRAATRHVGSSWGLPGLSARNPARGACGCRSAGLDYLPADSREATPDHRQLSRVSDDHTTWQIHGDGEQLQPRRARVGPGHRPSRARGHRVHSLCPLKGNGGPMLAGDYADPGHAVARAPDGEPDGAGHRAHGRGVRRALLRCPTPGHGGNTSQAPRVAEPCPRSGR